ncbi:AfsR/SARP family transcriptional regulator [Kibdelosporangium aridum]|uniref:DNA-binding transcriptional activator of the SARP family n=1 Tax=Kibdelosporangium aridum TaxID=2030 RepID=A0A1W2AUV9_KIBAR|nr:BTAD domain-containing putative transcriptional regulator [Kibdelosporangium aridum]SMC64404.1 DNA-binding transcriptional activator of the SARP family [Kibdelosporangium aridum]
MRFRALGPLEILDAGEWHAVRAPKWRVLLALLLSEADQVLSVDRIATELWGDDQPKTVGNQVHGYVSRLRKLLSDPDGQLLVTQAPGYKLRIEPQDTDLGRFMDLADRGRTEWRAGRPDEAAALLTDALALWRGSALQDVPATPLVQAEADRLNELRVCLQEDLAEINLLRGEHTRVATELSDLVTEHPLREHLRELQMLALYRQGRQAEALTAYTDLRDRLADELGVDPSPPLRRLHEQILRADGSLAPATPPRQDMDPASPVHQLPPDIPDFTAREEQLAAIAKVIAERSDSGPPPVAVVVGGPGVGKSTLAIHAAHTTTEEFPDGEFYLDLAGTSGEPRAAAVVLAEMLHALGITGVWLPDSLHARATLYRTLMARRRMLLVLDDAASADQVKPLLPSAGSCAVVVTSRTQLTDLPGAKHIDLDVFRPQEAHRLFTAIVGRDRVAAEPGDAKAIVRSCGYLPLAIRISGGKLAGRASWPLRVLRQRLANESKRLSELRVGELDVRASFGLSLRSLPSDVVRAFALLGHLGMRTFPGWVIGPLLDRAHSDDVLDALLDANLLQLTDTDKAGQPRYRLQGLLRTYALETAENYSVQTRQAAVARLLGAGLTMLKTAVDRLPPSLFEPLPGKAPRLELPPEAVGPVVAAPLDWLDAERGMLIGAVKMAAEWQMDEAAWEIAALTVSYYDIRSLHEDWKQSHELALKAVRANGNRRGEAVLLRGLAQVQIYRETFDEAVLNLGRSLALARDVADRRGEALAVSGLATVARIRGENDRALQLIQRSIDLASGDRNIEAQFHNGMAGIYLAQGRLDQAEASYGDALRLSRQHGDIHREAVVLREMSRLHCKKGATAQAMDCLRDALAVFEKLEDERCGAFTLMETGAVHLQRAESEEADKAFESAARLFISVGDHMEAAACRRRLTGHADAPAGG